MPNELMVRMSMMIPPSMLVGVKRMVKRMRRAGLETDQSKLMRKLIKEGLAHYDKKLKRRG